MGTVYLFHYERPIHPDRPCQHYLGWADNLSRRLQQHINGKHSASIPLAAKERGIAFTIARVWNSADRRLERQLRNHANNPRLCPTCNPDLMLKTIRRPATATRSEYWVTVPTEQAKRVRRGDPSRLGAYRHTPPPARVRRDGSISGYTLDTYLDDMIDWADCDGDRTVEVTIAANGAQLFILDDVIDLHITHTIDSNIDIITDPTLVRLNEHTSKLIDRDSDIPF